MSEILVLKIFWKVYFIALHYSLLWIIIIIESSYDYKIYKSWHFENVKLRITVLALARASIEPDTIPLHSISSFKKLTKYNHRGSAKWLTVVLIQSKPDNKKAILASSAGLLKISKDLLLPKYSDLFSSNCGVWSWCFPVSGDSLFPCFLGHHNLLSTFQFFCPFSTFLSGFPSPSYLLSVLTHSYSIHGPLFFLFPHLKNKIVNNYQASAIQFKPQTII